MEQELSGIENGPLDKVKLHTLHDQENLEDLRHSFDGVDARQRGQHMSSIITIVKDAVNHRVVGCGVNAEKVALYSVSKLEDADAPSAGLTTVKANLRIAATAAAAVNKNALENITYYRRFRYVAHVVFLLLLSLLAWIVLGNSSGTWKEITAAFFPQLYTLVFNLIELLYKVQVAEHEMDLGVSKVVHRGCDLVLRLIEHAFP